VNIHKEVEAQARYVASRWAMPLAEYPTEILRAEVAREFTTEVDVTMKSKAGH
jgi:hypothetical protein